jgi:hypothetical protein
MITIKVISNPGEGSVKFVIDIPHEDILDANLEVTELAELFEARHALNMPASSIITNLASVARALEGKKDNKNG